MRAEAIESALERVIGSKTFSRAVRLRRFLQHVVHEEIAGNGERLKEYAVGVAVFDRGLISIRASTPSCALRRSSSESALRHITRVKARAALGYVEACAGNAEAADEVASKLRQAAQTHSLVLG